MGFRCLCTDTWIALLCLSVCSVKYVCACVCLCSPGENLGGIPQVPFTLLFWNRISCSPGAQQAVYHRYPACLSFNIGITSILPYSACLLFVFKHGFIDPLILGSHACIEIILLSEPSLPPWHIWFFTVSNHPGLIWSLVVSISYTLMLFFCSTYRLL